MLEQAISHTGKKICVLLAMALAAMFASYLFATQSSRSEVPDHGDWQADMVRIVSARAFASYGFSSLNFGPVRDDGTELGLPPFYYTHFPPFPSIALGQLYRLGLTTAEARLFPLLISSSALIAIYLLATRALGDWRAGILAVVALAVSTPFRLLADSFASPSYDLAAKTWTLLFITLGCLATGWRRLVWLEAAGLGSLAVVALSGFEMAPALAAYAVLFPLLFAAAANAKERRRVVLFAGFRVAAGLLLGLFLRVAHNALLVGRLDVALADLATQFSIYSSTVMDLTWEGQYLPRLPQDYTIYYSTLLAYRAAAYYPFHLVAFLVGGMLAGVLHRSWDWRPFKWLGIVFFSEALWFVIFRGHTAMNVYTVHQLSLTVSLAVAITGMMVWRAARSSASRRYLAVAVGAALMALSLTYVGVQPRGNLAIRVDLTQEQQQLETFSAAMPADAVVVMSLGDQDPSPEFFLGRTFIRRNWLDRLDDSGGRPWFLLTQPSLDNAVYTRALSKNLLLKKTKEFALFDMNSSDAPPDLETSGVGSPGEGELHR